MLGGEGALAVGTHERVRHHRAQIRVVERPDLVHLVRRAEAVEEVQEGEPGLERGGVGHERQVLRLLDG